MFGNRRTNQAVGRAVGRGLGALIGGLLSGGGNKTTLGTSGEAYMVDVQTVLDGVLTDPHHLTIQVDEFPIKMKRNEVLLDAKGAIRGTWKNNGRYKAAANGFTLSIPIVKGIRYRAAIGGGVVAPTKSWVFDEQGGVLFTNQRIIFNGTKKNTTIPLSKILNFSLANNDSKMLYIDLETGSDVMLQLSQPLPVEVYAVLHALVYDNDFDTKFTVTNS